MTNNLIFRFLAMFLSFREEGHTDFQENIFFRISDF